MRSSSSMHVTHKAMAITLASVLFCSALALGAVAQAGVEDTGTNNDILANDATAKQIPAPIVVAQNSNIDEGCQRKTLVNIKNSEGERLHCKQGRVNKRTKYEHSMFSDVFESNDVLNVYHMKLMKKNWYFPSQESTVRNSLPKIFTNLNEATFEGGDQKIGLGGSYVFVPFELKNKSCFGFRKNRREKLTRGYYCRDGGDTFTAATVKPIVKQFKFR